MPCLAKITSRGIKYQNPIDIDVCGVLYLYAFGTRSNRGRRRLSKAKVEEFFKGIKIYMFASGMTYSTYIYIYTRTILFSCYYSACSQVYRFSSSPIIDKWQYSITRSKTIYCLFLSKTLGGCWTTGKVISWL